MIKSHFLYLIIGFLCYSNFLIGQNDPNKIGLVPKEITLEAKEQKLVDEAYDLFNNKEPQKSYDLAQKLKKSFSTKKALSKINLLLAQYFRNKILVDSSNYYVNQSLQIIESLQSANRNIDSLKRRINSSAYNVKGVNYKNQGLFEESRKWHLKGIEEAKKYNERNLYYTNTFGLASNYSESGIYDKAIKLFKECLNYQEDKEIVFGSYINLGVIFSLKKDYESAEEYFLKGKELSQKENNLRALAIILLSLASNEQDLNKLDSAVELYKEVIEISDKIDLKNIGLIARMNIGSVFIDSGNYTDAEVVYGLALHDAYELGLFNQQLNIYENLQQIAINQQDYKKAYNHLSNYSQIKDSIANLQKNKEINELEVRYETLQKEKEIKYLQVENRNKQLALSNQKEAIINLKLQQEIEKKESEIVQKENQNKILEFKRESEKRSSEISLLKKDQELKQASIARQKSIKNTILYSFLIILLPIIGLLFIYYQKLQTQSKLNEKQKEVNKQKIETLLKDKELEIIKANVEGQDKERKRIAQELHDSIGGNLAAIKLQLGNFVKEQKKLRVINDQIDETYQQVRDISHTLIPKKFQNNNFCDFLEDYFLKISTASNLNATFQAYSKEMINSLDENIQVEAFKIIQELIINTIKHAQAKTVEIQLNYIDNQLNILFEDDGKGFDPKQNSDGIGLRNIKSRIENLNGVLSIDSALNKGSVYNLILPQ